MMGKKKSNKVDEKVTSDVDEVVKTPTKKFSKTAPWDNKK